MAATFRSAAGASGASGGSAAVVTKPAGLAEGDLMIAISVGDNDGTSGNLTAPAAFGAAIATQAASAGQNPGVKVWQLVATSTEVAASNFSFSAGTGVFCSAGIVVIEAGTYDDADPIHLGPTFNVQTSNSTTHTAPSLASGVVDGLLITGHATDQGGAGSCSYTAPSGMTERVDTAAASGFSGLEMCTLALSGTGATGTKGATCTANRPSASVSLVINPSIPNTNASAQHASGTGAANNAAPGVGPAAGHASGTGAAHDATVDATLELGQVVIDDFNDGTINTGFWDDWGGANTAETAGVLRISVTDTVYAGLSSLSTLDLASKFAGSKVADAGDQAGIPSLEVYPVELTVDSDNSAYWVIADESVTAWKKVATVSTQVGGFAYSPGTHVYFAIGEHGGRMWWLWSTDTVTWHVEHSESNPLGTTDLFANVFAGIWDTGTDTVDLDDFSTFSVTVEALAELASGTGTAHAPTPSVATSAGHASGTGAAHDASVTGASNASAENAAGTGAAHDATTNVSAAAGNAAGTGTAYDAAVTGSSNASAEVAAGTGTAFNASTNVSGGAESASATGTAYDATTAVSTGAGHASGLGGAYDAQVLTESNASAENAAGTGTAYNAAPGVGPAAELASGTGTAYNATTTIDGSAELASGTGTAHAARPNVGPAAELASGTGAAHAVTAGVASSAGLAAGTGSAFNASVTASSNASAGHASGTGSAFDAAAGVGPAAELAEGTGTAYDGTTNVATGAGHAAGTGAAYDVRMAARFTAPLGTGTPTDNATRYAAGAPDDNVTRYSAGAPTDNVTRYAAGAPT